VAHATLLVAVHTCSASQAAMYNAQRGTRNTFGGCAHLQCLTSCSVQCSTWHTQHFWWLCTLAVPHKLQRTMLNVAHATLLVAVHTCSASQAAAYNAQCGTQHFCRVGQNHIYTVYIRYFWQGNHQILYLLDITPHKNCFLPCGVSAVKFNIYLCIAGMVRVA